MKERAKITNGNLSIKAKFYVAFACLALCAFFFIPNQAHAFCKDCASEVNDLDPNVWQESEDNFDERIEQEFFELQEFLLDELWNQSVLPVMFDMADQFTAIAIQQAMIVGTFFDAENQLAAQRKLQELTARAHKDYHPSIGMCEFGSVMKSLAATEFKTEIVSNVLAQRSLDRQLGKSETSGKYGAGIIQDNRIEHFRQNFCNSQDRASALAAVCTDLDWATNVLTEEQRAKIDKDIDYVSLVEGANNLKIDFTNQVISDGTIDNIDEENILALASNLFGHYNMPRPPSLGLRNFDDNRLSLMQRAYMDMRSVVAKRSVAENSLYAIAAMKSQGYIEPDTPGPGGVTDVASARIYMEHILRELGVTDSNGDGDTQDEILQILGEHPSYHAQMEVITKKMFQNPDFYTSLYDKPANIERKTVALQAINLMQKFDVLKSSLRDEASMSILLEIAISNLQSEIEDAIKGL